MENFEWIVGITKELSNDLSKYKEDVPIKKIKKYIQKIEKYDPLALIDLKRILKQIVEEDQKAPYWKVVASAYTQLTMFK